MKPCFHHIIFCNKTMEQHQEQDLPGILSVPCLPLELNP